MVDKGSTVDKGMVDTMGNMVGSMVDSMVGSMVDSMVGSMVKSMVGSMVKSMVGSMVDSMMGAMETSMVKRGNSRMDSMVTAMGSMSNSVNS